jgi:hypothetical protein
MTLCGMILEYNNIHVLTSSLDRHLTASPYMYIFAA